MSLLDLANELLHCIAEYLELEKDFNSFTQTNGRLYFLLNRRLYQRNIQRQDSSALLWAAKCGQEGTTRKLLEMGANFQVTMGGWTPLLWAAKKGHETIVRLLVAKDGIDPNPKDTEHDRTPLSWAAEMGHEEVVKLLLAKNGVDLNAKDSKYGRTPLGWAARSGYEAVVQLLLAKDGIDINAKDSKYGRTPLGWAIEESHETVVQLLLVKDGIDLDTKDSKYGQMPLGWAARSGHKAVVQLLLAKDGVDLNTKDSKYGETPLGWAAEMGHEEVVKLLLAKDGVDLNAKDSKYGMTPLLLAAARGREAVVKLLLAKDGINLNAVDTKCGDAKYGRTPLLFAASRGHEAVVKLLLAKDGINLNATDAKHGGTPLLFAAARGLEAVVELLLAKDGVDLNTKDSKYGETPLGWAAEMGHEAVVKLLLAKDGINLNATDTQYGGTPLLFAAARGHEAVVKLLLAKDGVDLNPKDTEHGRTPLSWAAEEGHEAVVKLLLAKDGIDLNTPDSKYGRTPLLWAVANKHEAIVQLISPEAFAYDSIPLNPPTDAIRLLTLLPGSVRVPISCTLFSVQLSECPEYEALSYCWKEAFSRVEPDSEESHWDSKHTIYCNGKEIQVLRNLYHALVRVRSAENARTIWVDAICINQSSVLEKNAQVPLMGQIYQRSRRTLVWLGVEQHDDDQLLFAAIRRIPKDPVYWYRWNPEFRPECRMLGPQFAHAGARHEMFKAWRKFLQRSWFQRTWIVQEVALARDIMVYCGDSSVSWSELLRAEKYCQAYATHMSDAPVGETVSLQALANTCEIQTQKASQSLLSLLIRHRFCQATDTRDKVFAFCGIAADSQGLVTPDYRQSLGYEEVFHNLTVTLLVRQECLDMLSAAGIHEAYFKQENPLPSWVPDWRSDLKFSCSSVVPIDIRQASSLWITKEADVTRHFHASMSTKPSVRFADESKILLLNGYHIDIVTEEYTDIPTPETQTRQVSPWIGHHREKGSGEFRQAIKRCFEIGKKSWPCTNEDCRKHHDHGICEKYEQAVAQTLMAGYPDGEKALGFFNSEFSFFEPKRETDNERDNERKATDGNRIISPWTSSGGDFRGYVSSSVNIFDGSISDDEAGNGFHIGFPWAAGLDLSDLHGGDFGSVLQSVSGSRYSGAYDDLQYTQMGITRPFKTGINCTRIAQGRKFGLTRNHRLALLPYLSKRGDHIALFEGGDLPYVVRPVGAIESSADTVPLKRDGYVLIGEAYVSGIMHGEAWDIAKCEPMKLV